MKNVTTLLIFVISVTFLACSVDETIDRSLLEQQQIVPTPPVIEEIEDLVQEVVEDMVEEDAIDLEEVDEEVVEEIVEEVVEEIIVEPIIIEEITEEVIEEIVEEVVEEMNDVEEFEITATEICFFSDIIFVSGAPTKINCLLDLEGKEVTVPSNAILEFDGGDIFNGTLNFINGTIDGRFLNSNLTIAGEVDLIDTTFTFMTSRFDIVEGETTEAIAIKNKEVFQDLIDQVKSMDGEEFKVGKLDAYFSVGLTHKNANDLANDAITIPSDFHFAMSENTYLRVQPNTYFSYVLLATLKAENTIITGGNLIGDRFKHDYNTVASTHEWGVLFEAVGSSDILIDGVNFKDATGDGVKTVATGLRNSDGSLPSGVYECESITIKNCVIDACRRNNISIVDGTNISIINNIIKNAGNGNTGTASDGIAPKYGVDVEAYREYDVLYASIKEYEKATNVIISNNIFETNEAGSIIIYSGDEVEISNNESDHMIYLRETSNSKVLNNTLKASSSSKYNTAITMGDFRMYTNGKDSPLKQFSLNNEVKGNVISGFNNGIRVKGSGGTVSNNQVTDFEQGLGIEKAEDTKVFGNSYISTQDSSHGIVLIAYGNNVDIYDEYIEVDKRYLYSSDFNTDTVYASDVNTYEITIRNSTLIANKPSVIYSSYGVNVIDNEYINSTLEISQSNNVSFSNNDNIEINDRQALVLNTTENVEILNNSFNITADVLSQYSSIESENDKNTLVSNNVFKQIGGDNVIQFKSSSNAEITNNTADISDSIEFLLYFEGNNSTLLENKILSGDTDRNYVDGSGNTL